MHEVPKLNHIFIMGSQKLSIFCPSSLLAPPVAVASIAVNCYHWLTFGPGGFRGSEAAIVSTHIFLSFFFFLMLVAFHPNQGYSGSWNFVMTKRNIKEIKKILIQFFWPKKKAFQAFFLLLTASVPWRISLIGFHQLWVVPGSWFSVNLDFFGNLRFIQLSEVIISLKEYSGIVLSRTNTWAIEPPLYVSSS